MELPIANHGSNRSADVLVRAAKRSGVIVSRALAEETSLPGATAFTNAERPQVAPANCVFDLTVPNGSTAKTVIDDVTVHFQERGVPCHVLHAASQQWPEDLCHLLSDLEYRRATDDLLLLEQYEPPKHLHAELQIIPIRAAYMEARRIYQLQAMAEKNADEATARHLADAQVDRLDESRLEVFLGRLRNHPVGVAGVMTLGNIGVIDPVFTDPEQRGSGIGHRLMAHVLDHCHRALFESVIVQRPDGCWSIPFYESLGFKRLAAFDSFVRE